MYLGGEEKGGVHGPSSLTSLTLRLPKVMENSFLIYLNQTHV